MLTSNNRDVLRDVLTDLLDIDQKGAGFEAFMGKWRKSGDYRYMAKYLEAMSLKAKSTKEEATKLIAGKIFSRWRRRDLWMWSEPSLSRTGRERERWVSLRCQHRFDASGAQRALE